MNSSKKLARNNGISNQSDNTGGEFSGLNKYKVLGIIGILAILVLSIGICYIQLRPREILEVTREADGKNDKEVVYLKDAMYNICATESQYNSYSSIYKQLYGTTYWEMEDADGKGRNGASAAKKEIMDTIKQETILTMEAKALGYELTDDEKKKAASDADEFIKNLTEGQKKMDGLDKDTVQKVLERKALADKYRDIIISESGFNEEEVKKTVNKNDYRQYDLQYYMISNNKDNKAVDKATKAKNLKAMKDLRAKATKASDFSKLVVSNSNQGAVSGSAATGNAVSGDSISSEESGIEVMKTEKLIAKDMNESNFLNKDLRKKLIKMKKGEISDVIEGDDGYYVVRMDNDNSEEAYNQECDSVVTEEKNNKVTAKMNEILPNYKVEVQAYWKKRVKIGAITLDTSAQ